MTADPPPELQKFTDWDDNSPPFKVIGPIRGWRHLDLRELFEYRDLFVFLVWRSLRVRYAQSILGIGWAVIQPLAQMAVYTVVFGYFIAIESDGAPYPVFAYAALLPWTLFSTSLTEAVDSLVAQTQLVSKIYFPRLLLPLAAVTSRLVDFAISAAILAGMLAWYGIRPTTDAAALPLLVFVLVLFAAGTGMWLSALAIQYRDVRYAQSTGRGRGRVSRGSARHRIYALGLGSRGGGCCGFDFPLRSTLFSSQRETVRRCCMRIQKADELSRHYR
jgi:hypothetical protein